MAYHLLKSSKILQKSLQVYFFKAMLGLEGRWLAPQLSGLKNQGWIFEAFQVWQPSHFQPLWWYSDVLVRKYIFQHKTAQLTTLDDFKVGDNFFWVLRQLKVKRSRKDPFILDQIWFIFKQVTNYSTKNYSWVSQFENWRLLCRLNKWKSDD